MVEDQKLKYDPNDESRIGSVSVRGWLAIMVVWTVCLMSATEITVSEPIYTLVGLIVGFYYGKNKK